ncbi:hypothetical protein C1N81_04245 (plasmid) [Streptomyces sp. SGAir0957]
MVGVGGDQGCRVRPACLYLALAVPLDRASPGVVRGGCLAAADEVADAADGGAVAALERGGQIDVCRRHVVPFGDLLHGPLVPCLLAQSGTLGGAHIELRLLALSARGPRQGDRDHQKFHGFPFTGGDRRE